MRSGVPSAAHTGWSSPITLRPLDLANVSFRFPSSIWEYAWPMIRGDATLVRRAKVLPFESLFERWSKVVACVDSYVRDGVVVLMLM
jgi:hypothetical protein